MDVLFDDVPHTCTLPMPILEIVRRGDRQHDLDSNHTDGGGG
jgi:hypothetical protein